MKRLAPISILLPILASCVSAGQGGGVSWHNREVVATGLVHQTPDQITITLANAALICWIGKSPAFEGFQMDSTFRTLEDPNTRIITFTPKERGSRLWLRISVVTKVGAAGTNVSIGVEQIGAEAVKRPIARAAREILKGQRLSCAS